MTDHDRAWGDAEVVLLLFAVLFLLLDRESGEVKDGTRRGHRPEGAADASPEWALLVPQHMRSLAHDLNCRG